MEPVTALLIASLIGSAVSGGAQVAKGVKQSKYEREVKAATDEERKKQEKEARRAALARAIGAASPVYAPNPAKDLPNPPSFVGEDIAGGIGSLTSQLAAYKMANPKIPQQPTMPQPSQGFYNNPYGYT